MWTEKPPSPELEELGFELPVFEQSQVVCKADLHDANFPDKPTFLRFAQLWEVNYEKRRPVCSSLTTELLEAATEQLGQISLSLDAKVPLIRWGLVEVENSSMNVPPLPPKHRLVAEVRTLAQSEQFTTGKVDFPTADEEVIISVQKGIDRFNSQKPPKKGYVITDVAVRQLVIAKPYNETDADDSKWYVDIEPRLRAS